jgi:hypothetical protein
VNGVWRVVDKEGLLVLLPLLHEVNHFVNQHLLQQALGLKNSQAVQSGSTIRQAVQTGRTGRQYSQAGSTDRQYRQAVHSVIHHVNQHLDQQAVAFQGRQYNKLVRLGSTVMQYTAGNAADVLQHMVYMQYNEHQTVR